MPVKPKPLEERFWSKVARRGPDECWEWRAGLHSGGYGMCYVHRIGHSVQAHRVAYELAHGPIPEGMCILHRCDNPPCVNPAHLSVGTQAENRADCVAKGRHVVPTPLCGPENPRAKLTRRDRQAICVLRANGVTRELLARAFDVTPKTITAVVREGASGSYLLTHLKATAPTP